MALVVCHSLIPQQNSLHSVREVMWHDTRVLVAMITFHMAVRIYRLSNEPYIGRVEG